MQHVLILDDDPGAILRLRQSLVGARVCLEQAASLVAAYRRIVCLPTLHVLIVNLAHPECAAVEDFARRVVPAITVIPVGPRGGTSSPGGPCAPWRAVMADLAVALPPDVDPGDRGGGWAG